MKKKRKKKLSISSLVTGYDYEGFVVTTSCETK